MPAGPVSSLPRWAVQSRAKWQRGRSARRVSVLTADLDGRISASISMSNDAAIRAYVTIWHDAVTHKLLSQKSTKECVRQKDSSR
jgi:hypothetical protein